MLKLGTPLKRGRGLRVEGATSAGLIFLTSSIANGVLVGFSMLDFRCWIFDFFLPLSIVLLLQFSTSHYCRKVRLALGYKNIAYGVENLTPGLHILQLKPLTGLTTVPVLRPQQVGEPEAIADSTAISQYLDQICPEPALYPTEPTLKQQAQLLEDWLDESIGTATRFVYYDYRAREGQAIDPSLFSRLLVNVVRRQYGISPEAVQLARSRLQIAMGVLSSWQRRSPLIGENLSIADLAAAALLSPLALVPEYRETYPWLFDRIRAIHDRCHEPYPPGL